MANPKGNVDNLKPFKKGAKETKEKGSKGGKRSREVARERKKAKDCMEMILKMDAKGKKSKELMSNMGIEEEEQQNIMLLMVSMFLKAQTTGDPSAIKAILELVGDMNNNQPEQTAPTININVSPATIEDIEDE